jgi:hypothetical protein
MACVCERVVHYGPIGCYYELLFCMLTMPLLLRVQINNIKQMKNK